MNVEIAERLAARRKEMGYSQEALAEKLGVSRQAVSKWERSESSPDTDNLIALAKLYGVSLDDLLYVDKSIEEDVEFEAADRAEKNQQAAAYDARSVDEILEHEIGKLLKESLASDTAAENKDSAHKNTTQDFSGTNSSCSNSNPSQKEYAQEGAKGIHFEEGEESVHISWRDGIHVKDSKKGEEVHVGWDGVKVVGSPDGEWYDGDESEGHCGRPDSFSWSKDGIYINNEHFNTWEEVQDKYGNRAKAWKNERLWLKFPFPLLVIIAYLLIGFLANEWALGLFVFFAIPVYYITVHSIYSKKLAEFVGALYPIGCVAWFLYMAFVLGQPHPAWVVFLTVPIIEWICVSAKKAWKKRKLNSKESSETHSGASSETSHEMNSGTSFE